MVCGEAVVGASSEAVAGGGVPRHRLPAKRSRIAAAVLEPMAIWAPAFAGVTIDNGRDDGRFR